MIRTVTICSAIIHSQRIDASTGFPGFISDKKHEIKWSARNRDRNLYRSCPPVTNSIWNTNLNDDILQEEITKNPYASNTIGERSNVLLQRMRRKESSFYQQIVNNMAMLNCNVSKEIPRCVKSNSENALKNLTGFCMMAADTACNPGMCEREANCYWNTIDSTVLNRTTRYAPDQYSKAKDALIGFNNSSYLRALLTICFIGVVIAIVLLMGWIIYFVGRCCCCCLWTSFSLCYACSPIPKDEGYLIFWHWILPALLFVLFSAVVVLAVFYSYMGACAMTISFTKSIAYITRLLEGLISTIDRCRIRLIVIQNTTDAAALDAISIYNNSYGVNRTMTQIFTFGSIYSPASSMTLAVFSNNLEPLVQTIETMVNTVKQVLYDGKSVTHSTISSVIKELDAYKGLLTTWLLTVNKVETTESSLIIYIKLGLMAIPLVSIVICAAGVFGLAFSSCKNRCKGCPSFLGFSGVLAAILGSVALVVASVFLTVNILWLDSCHVSDIVTSDFRPFLGQRKAILANQVMNGTDISIALGLANKFDFLTVWDDNLAFLYGINSAKTFATALQQMQAFQLNSIDTITQNATISFDALTSDGSIYCASNDHYSVGNIFEPWTANQGKNQTAWLLFNTGLHGDYKRKGNESGLDYIDRIYNIAGYCNSSVSCCLNQNCSLNSGYTCNSGSNCKYICSDQHSNIIKKYNIVLDAYSIQQRMTADWGISCPSDASCPTDIFRNLTNDNQTVADLITSSEHDIANTAERLMNTATTPVGLIMDNIHEFTCNTNISFVGLYYSLAKDEFCGAMVDGFAQINVSLWVISAALEVLAVLLCILSIRLRGRSRKEKLFDTNYDDLVTVVTAYKPSEE